MKLTGLLLAITMALLVPVAAVQAGPITYVATLNGSNQNPSNSSPGTGYGEVTVDPLAHTMLVNVSFSELLGTTTAAHIHCCTAPPGNAGVATQTPTFVGFPLGVTSGTYTSPVFDLTLDSSYNAAFIAANGGTAAGAEAALLGGLAAGNSYLNLHTTQYPGGEIRGFLEEKAVPDPGSSLLLLGIGVVGLRVSRKRLG